MRSTPLAVWASGLGFDDFRKASNAETQLTHPNGAANDAVFLYNLAIKYLLQNHIDEDRAQKAFELCEKTAKTFRVVKNIHGNQDISLWIAHAK